MPNTIVTVSDVIELLGRDLTDVETARTQLDLDTIVEVIENWIGRPLTEKVITDERHYVVAEYEALSFHYRPVKSVTGIKFDKVTNPLVTSYNDYQEEATLARGTVYYITYVTDASEALKYYSTIKRAAAYAVIESLLKNDSVRFGVVTSYSVEGTSISYSASTDDATRKGPVSGADLSSLESLRGRVRVW